MRITMRLNEIHHHFDRRSSSAIAKYAEALRRISLAWRNSRFSRSRAFILSAISLGTPARLPLSTSAFLTQSFSVFAEQPIFAAIDVGDYLTGDFDQLVFVMDNDLNGSGDSSFRNIDLIA